MVAKNARKNAKKASSTKNSLDRKTKRRPELVVKAIADPKTRAKIARKQMGRRPLTWSEWAILGMVATCIVAVLCSFVVKASFHPEQDAEKSLERLVSAYYTEYLYPRMAGEAENAAQEIAQYKNTGFPLVYLRQMLTFDDYKYADEEQYFKNEYYECDENTSRVHFVPVEPYGIRDYTYTPVMNCERL